MIFYFSNYEGFGECTVGVSTSSVVAINAWVAPICSVVRLLVAAFLWCVFVTLYIFDLPPKPLFML